MLVVLQLLRMKGNASLIGVESGVFSQQQDT
jgi:hypothetical protein